MTQEIEYLDFQPEHLIPVVGLLQEGYNILFTNKRVRMTSLQADVYSLYQAVTTVAVFYGLENCLIEFSDFKLKFFSR